MYHGQPYYETVYYAYYPQYVNNNRKQCPNCLTTFGNGFNFVKGDLKEAFCAGCGTKITIIESRCDCSKCGYSYCDKCSKYPIPSRCPGCSSTMNDGTLIFRENRGEFVCCGCPKKSFNAIWEHSVHCNKCNIDICLPCSKYPMKIQCPNCLTTPCTGLVHNIKEFNKYTCAGCSESSQFGPCYDCSQCKMSYCRRCVISILM